MVPNIAAWQGVARSLRVYRLDRDHAAGLKRLYRPFVKPGDLVFDVGAHVGDRVAAFRALGCRVVAVEPQRRLAWILRRLHGGDPMVTVRRCALGPDEGEAVLRVNSANPTVTTRSDAFLAATEGAAGWEGQVWDAEERAPATTLDALAAEFGTPAFVKIDVEGFEAEVLSGLRRAEPPALSFEVVAAARDAGVAALEGAVKAGFRSFRFSIGERHGWATDWVGAPRMREVLARMPDAANSGDVYCRR